MATIIVTNRTAADATRRHAQGLEATRPVTWAGRAVATPAPNLLAPGVMRPCTTALLLAALAPLPVAAAAQPPSGDAGDVVARIQPTGRAAARVAWAPRGDRIAFDRPDADGLSRIFVARPDGGEERCLTCRLIELRSFHTASAAWQPSGEHLVFRTERPIRRDGRPLPFGIVPGGHRGDDDLWAIHLGGRQFWNLTHRGEAGGRVLAPRFAREGDRLLWSERLASGGGSWGRWALQVARFDVRRGVPRLRGTTALEPGAQKRFKESCDFTADDRGVLFAGNLSPDQDESGLDVYSMGLDGSGFRNLTSSPEVWDRFARYSPNGRWIVWASSRDIAFDRARLDRRGGPADVPTDLWLMSSEGIVVQRLTRFNDVFSVDYIGRTMVGPPAWSPAGDLLLVPVAPLERPEDSTLFRVELASPFGR